MKVPDEQALTLEQAGRAIVLAFRADVPVALWGPPGSGKSSLARQMTYKLDGELCDVRLSDKMPSDLAGIVVPQEGSATFLKMPGLPFGAETFTVLLLDEYDRAEMETQNASLQLVLDRSINGHRLGENVRIILAGNGTTDMGTTPLSRAAANRMLHLYVSPTLPKAVSGWLAWAEDNNVSKLTRDFIAFRPDALGSKPDFGEELAYYTSRSWADLDRLLGQAENVRFPTNDIVPAIVKGMVGNAVGSDFLSYRDIHALIPQIDDIISAPEITPVPNEPGTLSALATMLASYAERNKRSDKKVSAIIAYGARWPREQARYLFSLLERAHPNKAAEIAQAMALQSR
jgi:MoxR-like ATPase